MGPEAKADTSGYISEPSKVEIAGVIGLAATDKAIKSSQEFVAWLEQGIKDGKISYNEANSFIQVISEKEAVILPKAIEEFAQFKNMDAKAVLQQLNNASGIIDFNNLPMLLAQSGEAFNALMRINPYLIFPRSCRFASLDHYCFSYRRCLYCSRIRRAKCIKTY